MCRLRWTVTAMYAVLTGVLQDEDKESERAKSRPTDQRPKRGLFAVKRLDTALPWLKAEMLIEQEPLWGVVTDASPGRIGGVLLHRVGGNWIILGAVEAPMLPHHATALEIESNKPSGQAVLEGLAILRALQIWSIPRLVPPRAWETEHRGGLAVKDVQSGAHASRLERRQDPADDSTV